MKILILEKPKLKDMESNKRHLLTRRSVLNIFIAVLLIVISYFIGKATGYLAGEKSVEELYYFVHKPDIQGYDVGFRRGKEEGIRIGKIMQQNEDFKRKR